MRYVLKRDKDTCQLCGEKAKWFLSDKKGVIRVYKRKPIPETRYSPFNSDHGESFEIDHIILVCCGGENIINNLRLLYRTCNRVRGSVERSNNGMV